MTDRLKKCINNYDDTLRRFSNDEDFYLDCLSQLLIDPAFGNIKFSMNSGDYQEAQILTLTMLDVFVNMGIEFILDKLYEINRAILAKDKKKFDLLYSQLIHFNNMILVEIKK